MATTEPDDTGPDEHLPIIGRSTKKVPRTSFRLAWTDSRDTEHIESFTARANLDSGSIFAFAGRGNGDPIHGIQNLLLRSLVDDDGVSREVQPVPFLSKGGEPGAELVPLADVDTDRVSDLAAVQYRLDGVDDTFPSEDLADQYARANGSSLRRFGALVDDPYAIVHQDALVGIVDHIVSAAADRPTQPSRASSGSRRTRGRSGR